MSEWMKPGRSGGLLYAVAALVLGTVVAVISRLRMAEHRGRRRAARQLPSGAIIVVSNHASYADGILLALVCRRHGRSLRLMATAGLFRAPGLGPLVRRLGFIPVERGSNRAGGALQAAAQALAAGEAVGIFPEGRTTRDPQHWPERAKTGAVRLALQTGAPIVPVALVGTHRLMPRSHPLRSILSSIFLRPEVLTKVGQPIELRMLAGDDPSPQRIKELSDLVMGRIVALVEELRHEVAPSRTGVDPAADLSPPADRSSAG